MVCEGSDLILEFFGVCNMAFLDNNEMFLKGFKCFREVFVTVSQALVLGDEGVGFFLKAFKAGRLSIMDR